MSAITARTSTGVAVFDPAAAKTADAKLDAVIDYARRVQDWPLLSSLLAKKHEMVADFEAMAAEGLLTDEHFIQQTRAAFEQLCRGVTT